MDHLICVDSLVQIGVSTEPLRIIIAFLTEIRIKFKINGSFSSERLVKEGSPQGTKLGNFLFINTIEDNMSGLPATVPTAEQDEYDNCYGLRSTGRIVAIRRFNSGVDKASTPHKKGTTDGILRYLDNSGRENSLIRLYLDNDASLPRSWPVNTSWVQK